MNFNGNEALKSIISVFTCSKCKQLMRQCHQVSGGRLACRTCLSKRAKGYPCPEIDAMIKAVIEFENEEETFKRTNLEKEVKFSASVERRNPKGETQLHRAAIKNDLEKCKSFVAQGHNVNCVDNAGWTPLHDACFRGNHLIVDYLISVGANVNAIGNDDEQSTPLQEALKSGNEKCINILYKHGALLSKDLPKPKPTDRNYMLMIDKTLDMEIRIKLEQICDQLKLDQANDQFTSSVSHYICAKSDGIAKRNVTYLKAILSRCWLLNCDWLFHSEKAGDLLDEKNYLISASHKTPNCKAPKICTTLDKPIFQGLTFYLYGEFKKISRKDIVGMIKEFGSGFVLNRLTTRTVNDNIESNNEQNVYIIYDENVTETNTIMSTFSKDRMYIALSLNKFVDWIEQGFLTSN